MRLASELENWTERYSRTWHEVNRQSELFRNKRVQQRLTSTCHSPTNDDKVGVISLHCNLDSIGDGVHHLAKNLTCKMVATRGLIDQIRHGRVLRCPQFEHRPDAGRAQSRSVDIISTWTGDFVRRLTRSARPSCSMPRLTTLLTCPVR